MPRNTFYDGAAGDSVTIDTRVAQASTSATAAAASETAAATSATGAATSATASAASYDSFDDRYLGAKSSAPTVDNDGAALVDGALYWNTSSDQMFSWHNLSYNNGVLNCAENEPPFILALNSFWFNELTLLVVSSLNFCPISTSPKNVAPTVQAA